MTAALSLLLLLTADDLYRRGTQAINEGNLDRAVQLLAEASKNNPKDAQVWKALGVAHAAAGNYEAATEPFRQACTLNAALPDACYYLGRNLYSLNRFSLALDALRKSPRNWRVTLGIAQALEALEQAPEAESSFRAAVREHAGKQSHPEFDPRLHYAVFLYRQGRTAEALPMAQAAATDNPGSGRAQFELGRVHYALTDLEKAAAHLEQAVKNGHGAPAHLLLGKTYMRLGRTEAAQQHLKAGAAP
ncbi:MAG TPA: tetratricopeptide repeat protein [Bryobacteraceae bacterium]|nr:tetratricopeptide repeat protein [Bryobacteraceae bacterium]